MTTNSNREEWEERLGDIRFETEDALICPVCNTAFPSGTFSFNLLCRTPGCQGVVETPGVRYQRLVRELIPSLLQANREAVIKECLEALPKEDDGISKGTGMPNYLEFNKGFAVGFNESLSQSKESLSSLSHSQEEIKKLP